MNSFRDALKKLVTNGLAERYQDLEVFTAEAGRCRCKVAKVRA